MNIHLDPKYERKLEGLALSEGKSVDKVLEEIVREALESRHVSEQPETSSQRSLLELRGLGKEIWEGVDPVQYINELRDDWDD